MRVELGAVELNADHLVALRYFLGRRGAAKEHEVRGIVIPLVGAWLDDLVSRRRLARLAGAPDPVGSHELPAFEMWLEGKGPAGD